jgi:hypothetical protein
MYCWTKQMTKLPPMFTVVVVAILILSSFNVTMVVNAQTSPTLNMDWHFIVEGLVDHPLNLTLSDLEAMPQTVVTAAIFCVDTPSIPLYSSCNWTGVQLSTLLNLAEVSPSAVKVAFNASDGYSTDLNMSAATRGNVILAYENDDGPLIGVLRLVVPGEWGYKWISQVTSIMLVDYDYKGTFESIGYSDDADIQLITNPLNQTNTTPVQSPADSKPSNSTLPPSPQPSNSSATLPSEGLQSSGNFSTELAALVIASVCVSACLLVYASKRRHRLTSAE